MIDISVKNMKVETPTMPWDVKVDRSSYFGNRFVIRTESERDIVCDHYRQWFYDELDDSIMQAELIFLKDILSRYGKLNLFCWCAPKRCHADVIREYLENESEGIAND